MRLANSPTTASVTLLMVVGLTACDRNGPPEDAGSTDSGGFIDSGGSTDSGPPPPFELTSTAFDNGGIVPLLYECGAPVVPTGPGANVSPPLSWTAGPPQTVSYALVVRDVDAGGLVHWVVYDLPATTFSLPEDVPEGYAPTVLGGGHQAELQGSGYYGYLGPCSPGSVNTYRFTLHALDTATPPGVTMATTENVAAAAIEAASIASAVLDGES